MTDFRVRGGKKLSGSITTNTSKNGALGLLCASLINKGTTTLHGIPRIEEISRMLEVFESLDVSVEEVIDQTVSGSGMTLRITPPMVWNIAKIHRESASKMRSVLMLLGSLVHHVPEFRLPHAGGCKMGDRTIAAHRHGLEALGVFIVSEENDYHVVNQGLHSADVVMYEASDTAAINILIAASRMPSTTIIRYAPPNYQVQDVCYFLQSLGVTIEGIGTHILTVKGLPDIEVAAEHYNSEDPIESMGFITAAIMTKSELTITRSPIRFLEVELLKLRYMGLQYDMSAPYKAHNGVTDLVDITVHPSELIAPEDKIHPLPYPGLNIDNLPYFAPIATQATGTTLIHDWAWESRAIHFTELNKLGADVKLADPHRVYITGPSILRPAEIMSPPALRPAMVVLLAMLAAPGESILRNIYSISRGYENIAARLNAIGADIDIIGD